MRNRIYTLLTLLSFVLSCFGEVVSISSPAELIAFANRVNAGELTLDAVLTSDIDMDGQEWAKPIGCWTPKVSNANVVYKGHFDGQGYAIKNFTYTTKQNYHGLFGVVSTGALIENFTISGTVTNASYTEFGTVGFARDTDPTIRNVHSCLNFDNTKAGVRLGGILGNAYNGTTNIERCTYSGTITTADAENNGNYGGMVGIGNNAVAAICNITDCLFDGVIKNTAATPGNCTFGGMVGYSNSAIITIKNCISIGSVQSKIYGQFWGAVKSSSCAIINSFYQGDVVNGSASTVTLTGATKVTDEQLASGELCFTLNGGQSESVNWFQKIGTDACPTPNGTDVVYLNGRQHCDGTPYDGAEAYSNENAGVVVDKHVPVDGFCSVCGKVVPDAYAPVDGYFEIGDAKMLKWFAAYVNQVDGAVNAKLTADIDMQGVEVEVIGNSPANAYKGIFDGQGHNISNYLLTVSGDFTGGYGYGMFGNVRASIIKDFTIDGTMLFDNNEGKTSDLGCGLIGWLEGGSFIQNIKSTMTIDAKISTHVGGIVGSLRDASIDCCEFAGTLNGYTSSNGVAGITGYTNLGAITNCVFSGTVTGTGTGYFGGILGYVNNGNAMMKNCFSFGNIENTVSVRVGSLVSYLRNISTYSNNFYKGTAKGIGGGELATSEMATSNTTLPTDEQLASGEVTYKLGFSYRQKIGTDALPKIGKGNDIVILNGTYQNAPADLSLSENNDFGTNVKFDVTAVTLTKTLKGGNWETFCVPFDMTAEEITSQLGTGAEVMEPVSVSEDEGNYTITFSTASKIVAGKLYMVRVQSDVNSISLGSKTIKRAWPEEPIGDLLYVGLFSSEYAPSGSFIVSGNKTSRASGIVSLKPFQGYFMAPDGILVNTLTFGLDGIEDGIAPAIHTSDKPTFAVLGNSISTYYDYIPSGYAIYYTTDREKNNDIQVGDQWWMQLSRMSGLSFLANAAWSGSRVAYDNSTLNGIGPFCSDARVKALGRAGNPDFIFVLGGTNDWAHSSNIPLGEYCTDEFKDSLSFRGAYSLLLHKLTTRYPKARVVCLSILPRGEAATQVNAAGWSQNDGNASIKHIAEQFGQYFIDCSTIPFSSDWSKYMISGNLHPTAAGFTLMAEHITKELIAQGIISADLKRSDEVAEANRLLDISFTQDGIVNKGTYDAKVGKQGTATTVFDEENNVYLGSTKALASDYFYATYDEGTPLADAFNNSVTWEMLVRLDNLADQDGNVTKTCIMGNDQEGGWAFYNSDYASTFSYTHKSGVKSSVKNFNGSRILTPGRFYHLVVTMDRTSHVIRYFVNGQLVRTGTRAATDMPLPQCGTIKGHQGMWICLGGDATSGACDSKAENSSACSFVFARIYEGALTEDAAANLYTDEVKKFTMATAAKISNATDLLNFASQVNAGEIAADAVLVNDIDMTGVEWPAPIGLWGDKKIAYKGHFDGKGHAIKNLTYTTKQNYHGLFGVISTDALIENFSLSGSITNSAYSPFGAVAGFARDDNPTIRNVWSTVNINNSQAGARVGGILGHSNEVSTVNIDRCTYSGTLTANDAGGSGNYGGIVGYTQNAVSTVLNITSCLFDGEVKNSAATPGNCTFGGLVGYIGASPKVTAQNCLSIGKVESKITGQFYGAVKNTSCSIANSYYQGDNVNGSASTVTLSGATKVTDEQLASGEVAYNLGGAFRQNIGTDTYPILDDAKGIVNQITETGYATMYVADVDITVPEGVAAYAGIIDGGYLSLKSIEGKVAASEPVILKGAAGYYSFVPTTDAVKAEQNDLKGAAEDIDAAGRYVLAKPDGGEIGFYLADSGTIKAGKAYLESASGVKAFIINEEGTTSLNEELRVKNEESDDAVYDLLGRKINSQFIIHNSQLPKGVNIVNGHKVLR
ncbi:MAG: hypothetical protein IJ826_04430 [Bacteroidaceae bacterium]|nr:hypothetical protein [Bacteroidaceae bacterium]